MSSATLQSPLPSIYTHSYTVVRVSYVQLFGVFYSCLWYICWLKQGRKCFGLAPQSAKPKPSPIYKHQRCVPLIQAATNFSSSLDTGGFRYWVLVSSESAMHFASIFDYFCIFIDNGDRLQHWIGCCDGLQRDRSWYCCFRRFREVRFLINQYLVQRSLFCLNLLYFFHWHSGFLQLLPLLVRLCYWAFAAYLILNSR